MTDRGSRRAYLDSMVFIYAVEGDQTTGPPARELVTYLQSRPDSALTSELALAEVLALTRTRGKVRPELRQLYLDLLADGGWLAVRPVSRGILLGTAEIRPLGMKLPDAIHIATAIADGCRYLVSRDFGLRLPDNLTRLAPDADGLAHIRGAFA